jgi:hypothetical protein
MLDLCHVVVAESSCGERRHPRRWAAIFRHEGWMAVVDCRIKDDCDSVGIAHFSKDLLRRARTMSCALCAIYSDVYYYLSIK